jgi:hypothetical protein
MHGNDLNGTAGNLRWNTQEASLYRVWLERQEKAAVLTPFSLTTFHNPKPRIKGAEYDQLQPLSDTRPVRAYSSEGCQLFR